MYSKEALKKLHCQNWFARFHFDNFKFNDEQRCDRPVEIDDDQIKTIIHTHRHSKTCKIANYNCKNVCHTHVLLKSG